MATWVPDGDRVHCTLHDERFKRGHVCPHCTPEDLETPSDRVQPDAGDLPNLIAYERRFIAIADATRELAESLAEEEPTVSDKGIPGPDPRNTAVKFFDTTIKALRAAVELARYREDWSNLDRLQSLVAELRNRKAPRAEAVSH